MHRVAAIGLDAAEWPLLERWMDDGTLPNLARLRGRSARSTLENLREYRSESVWGQFATGQHPSHSGRWTNVRFDPATYDVADIGAGDEVPFWSRPSVTPAVVFDLPHTALRDDPDVVHVTGWGSHSSLFPRASRPVGLLREIDERFGPHPAFNRDNAACWYDEAYLGSLVEACEVGAHRRVDICRWLMARTPDWRLFVTAMSEPHSVGHHAWHGIDADHVANGSPWASLAEEAMRRTYVAVDDAVGRFEALLPEDTTLVVFALHGMQSNTNDIPALVLLPELLYRLETGQELLRSPRARAWEAAGRPPLLPTMTWGDDVAAMFAEGRGARVRRALAGVLPPKAFRALVAARSRLAGRRPPTQAWGDIEIPTEVDVDGRDLVEDLEYQPPTWYRHHWPSMRAFALPTFSDGQVRVNLEGREASGRVAPGDYARVCQELVDELHRCTDARTGGSAVADVVLPNLDAPLDPMGPPADLIVLFEPNVDAIVHPTVGLIGPVPLMRTGEHSSRGFAFVSGPRVEPTDLGSRPATDVAPTLLALLGAARDEVDGDPLVGAPAAR